MPETNEPTDGTIPAPAETTAADRETIARAEIERALQTPTLFDLVGYSIAAAHATSAAAVAQLNVALAAFRLLQVQKDSVSGGDMATIEDIVAASRGSEEALRRLVRRDPSGKTGGERSMPSTFGTGRPDTLDSADTPRAGG